MVLTRVPKEKWPESLVTLSEHITKASFEMAWKILKIQPPSEYYLYILRHEASDPYDDYHYLLVMTEHK